MENLDRHVSIILFADIVGYTSMMQNDEQNSLLKLDHFEKTIRSKSLIFDGEIIKSYGDGCLLLFQSAVKAVQCALEIQIALMQDLTVPLRIGIHIGEIVRKKQDVFGNGINIASRIESMGVSNSILISSDVFLQIENHKEFEVQDLGSFDFKNVKRPINLYAIKNNNLNVPTPKQMKGKGKKSYSSIAYGITRTKLTMYFFIVIAAFFIYKNLTSDTENSKEVLSDDPSALQSFFKGRLHQNKETLADIDSAIIYYKDAITKDESFAMAYSDLASTYMRKFLSFDPQIIWEQEAYSAAEMALLLNPNLANPHIVRGQFFWSQSHNFAHEEAMIEFNKAIERDSKLSEAYEQLSLVQLHVGLFLDAKENALKSLTLKPGNFRARRFIAEILLFQGKYESALKEFEKIPDNFAAHPTQSLEALTLYYLNQTDSAIQLLQENLAKDPNNPNLNSVYAIILSSKGMVSEAEEKIKLALDNSRDFIHVHHIYYHFGISKALMGKDEEAVVWLKKAADTGFPNYPLFKSDPNFKSLHGHPEYEKMLIDLKEKWNYYKTI